MRDEYDLSKVRSKPNPYAKRPKVKNEVLKVLSVKPLENYILYVKLSDGRSGYFDIKPYLDKGVFKQLKDVASFNEVKIYFSGIGWPCGPDLCADTIAYELYQVVVAGDRHKQSCLEDVEIALERSRKPAHPGCIIKRVYLDALDISVSKFAKILRLTRSTVSQIINERARVTPKIALRLAMAFTTTSAEVWMDLQRNHDLFVAVEESKEWQQVEEVCLAESFADESLISEQLNSNQLVIDPIVEQIRRHRREHSAKHGHDLNRIVENLREREGKTEKKLVYSGPRFLKDKDKG